MSKAVIVGAGITGLMSARALMLEGWSVELIDQSPAAQESTWAGGGILSPMNAWRYPDPVTALAKHGYEVYGDLADGLASESLDPECLPGGLLSISPPDIDEAVEWSSRWNVDLEAIDADAVRDLEPALGPSEGASVFMPKVLRIRPPRLGKSMKAWVLANGAVIHENTEVLGFEHAAGRITAVTSAQGSFSGDVVIVTAGAWTRLILAKLGTTVEIDPVRGQIVLFNGADGLLDRVVLDGDRYLIPRRDGRMLIGSTVEMVGFDKTTSEEVRAELRDVAVSMLPALADCPVEHHWAGLRPGKLDHVPIISAHPEYENLFINAGHYRNGVILSPGSSQLLADLVLGRDPWVDPEPYRLAA